MWQVACNVQRHHKHLCVWVSMLGIGRVTCVCLLMSVCVHSCLVARACCCTCVLCHVVHLWGTCHKCNDSNCRRRLQKLSQTPPRSWRKHAACPSRLHLPARFVSNGNQHTHTHSAAHALAFSLENRLSYAFAPAITTTIAFKLSFVAAANMSV